MLQQANAVLRGGVCPEIVGGFYDGIAFQIGLIPQIALRRVKSTLIQAGPVRRAVNELLGVRTKAFTLFK